MLTHDSLRGCTGSRKLTADDADFTDDADSAHFENPRNLRNPSSPRLFFTAMFEFRYTLSGNPRLPSHIA